MNHTPVVTIVAGGWSAGTLVGRHVDRVRLAGHVIAVNDAAVHLREWDTLVSMDRMWTEDRWSIIADALLAFPRRRAWLRRSAVQNIRDARELAGVEVFECNHESSLFAPACDPPRALNGTNSGACALNLAWQMRPGRLYLLGFDMNRNPKNGHPYWYPAYSWTAVKGATTAGKYNAWAGQFGQAAADFRAIGCQVYNVSPSSAIEAFPKISPEEYLRAVEVLR